MRCNDEKPLRWHQQHCHNNLHIIVIISTNHPNEKAFANRIYLSSLLGIHLTQNTTKFQN